MIVLKVFHCGAGIVNVCGLTQVSHSSQRFPTDGVFLNPTT